MTNPAHILETGVLVLLAYLLGCCLGYGLRYGVHRIRGSAKARPHAVSAAEPGRVAKRAPSPAARLARAVTADLATEVAAAPIPLPTPATPQLDIEPTAPLPTPAEVKKKPKAGAKSSKAKPASAPKPADPKPAALLRPRGGEADDLKKIKGIGPKIEASLNGLGIYHFDQIAAWTTLNTEWVDGQLAFKGRIRREQWIEQAIELAKK